MLLRFHSSMPCLRLLISEDNSSSSSSIGYPLYSTLYRLVNGENTMISVLYIYTVLYSTPYVVYETRFVWCPAIYVQFSIVRIEYKPFVQLL